MIEVMIVVAIIAILGTLAYPSYRDYIIRGRIPEGLALLGNERIVMEKFLADNRVYSGTPPSAAAGAPSVDGCARYTGTPRPVASQYFYVACQGDQATATSYTLVATGTGSMAGFSYTIDQSGAKATTGLGAGWTFPPTSASGSCYSTGWVLKRDGSC